MADKKLPSDRARAYDDSKDPPSFKAFDKQWNKEKGPNVISPPDDYTPPDKSAFKKGGPTKFNKGGSVRPSTRDAMKQNIAETVANPTGRTGLRKGGSVAAKPISSKPQPSGGRRPGMSGRGK
jgi:hypothetical protein